MAWAVRSGLSCYNKEKQEALVAIQLLGLLVNYLVRISLLACHFIPSA